MTKQEAIEILDWIPTKGDEVDAMEMAIEALRFADEYHQSNIEAYARDMGVSLEQAERELRVEELSCSEKPNRSDTIYRQDAIDVAKQHWYKPDIAKALKELPFAQPERKKGEWVETEFLKLMECSCCHVRWGMYDVENFKFCPNCGTDMRGKQDG